MEGAQQDSPARFIWQRGGTNSLESQYKILTAQIGGGGGKKKRRASVVSVQNLGEF